MKCRHCKKELNHVFINLYNAPPSNSYLKEEQLNQLEVFYPLKVFVCDNCFLVQVDEYQKHENIFNEEYAYFSSYSKTWLQHAKAYVEEMTKKLKLDNGSFVMEIACNDGYLLQYFKERSIPCLGIEPTQSTADVAKEKGLDILKEFFTFELAKQLKKADLILGNNVLAHVPDINGFVKGLKAALKPTGTITMEFPHVLNLIKYVQFDTIYHEHFSYLSLYTVQRIFESQGLKIYDTEEISTHGGSLRIYATHIENDRKIEDNVEKIIKKEKLVDLDKLTGYVGFENKVQNIKFKLLDFLIKAKYEQKKVMAYGAAAKGNTLLNYCGIKSDLIAFIADITPAKQGKYLPGSHIPVVSEDTIAEIKPDYLLILPWNWEQEIVNRLTYARNWDVQFVIAIPNIKVF